MTSKPCYHSETLGAHIWAHDPEDCPSRDDYRISWSAEDGEYVATCAEFPSLSWLDPNPIMALGGLIAVIADASGGLA